LIEHVIFGITGVIVLGIIAQWIAWRLQLPSILFLLIMGYIAGPVTSFIKPDELFGNLLIPIISVSVAIILFEGGLALRISELREIGKVVKNLITIGVVVTWLFSALLAHYLLKLNWVLSVLLGAILVVTGPTVIGPLLRHIRPGGRVGNIIKWEGIMNDPIGALLSVLIFQTVLVGTIEEAATLILISILKTFFFAGIVAVLGALLLAFLFRQRLIPDFLQEEMTLVIVLIVFVFSNYFQAEAGLFAVTIMGITLANQKKMNIKHIVEFKENLRVLIISSLFIILGANLSLDDFGLLNIRSIVFLGSLLFIVRPIAVFLSTIKSGLNWRERLFIICMAPRGIVAAAVSAVFVLQLSQEGIPQTEYIIPLIFMVIIGTVIFYGVTAPFITRWMNIAEINPQGILFFGAHSWARAIARALQEQNIKTLLIDSDRFNEYSARLEGLKTFYSRALSEHILNEIDLSGIGRLVALTDNDELNSLSSLYFSEIFGRSEVYQLSPKLIENRKEEEFSPRHLRGRFLFGKDINFNVLSNRFTSGAVVKATKLSDDFNFETFQKVYGRSVIPIFLIDKTGKLTVFTANNPPEPKPEQILISIVDPI
jgi:NhaP-type Na+/H+ or K+/H+ antiporter